MPTSSSIPSLTKDQISQYLGINAFAVNRPDAMTQLVNDQANSGTVKTTSVQQSLGLLSNLTKNLTTVQSNLTSMRQLAQEARYPDRLSEDRRQEIYADLRSLSAGIDIITGGSKLDNKTLLTGRHFDLSTGNSSVRLDLANVASSGTDSLNLSQKADGGFTTLSYSVIDQMNNANTDLVGLDISSATPAPIADGAKELDNGDYRVKISYAGPTSSVEILNQDGTSVKKVDNVDLSGNGQELVDMGNGVSFSFEKTYFETALGGDKWDYDLFGPVSLYAHLNYQQNQQHQLLDGDGNTLVQDDSVNVVRGGSLNGTTGTLGVTAKIAGVQSGVQGMTTGQYDVKIKYAGDRSSVWLYGPNGNLVSTKRGIDLTAGKPVAVDMESGVKLTLDPSNFTSANRDYHTYLNYQAADVPDQVFDYEHFTKQLDAALATVGTQIQAVADAQGEITSRYQLTQQASQGAGAAAGVSTASAVTSLIGGTLDTSLFSAINNANGTGAGSAVGGVLLSSGDIFTSLQSALSAQANVDPTILSQLHR